LKPDLTDLTIRSMWTLGGIWIIDHKQKLLT